MNCMLKVGWLLVGWLVVVVRKGESEVMDCDGDEDIEIDEDGDSPWLYTRIDLTMASERLLHDEASATKKEVMASHACLTPGTLEAENRKTGTA